MLSDGVQKKVARCRIGVEIMVHVVGRAYAYNGMWMGVGVGGGDEGIRREWKT